MLGMLQSAIQFNSSSLFASAVGWCSRHLAPLVNREKRLAELRIDATHKAQVE